MLFCCFACGGRPPLRLLGHRQHLPGRAPCFPGMNNSEAIKGELFVSGFPPQRVRVERRARGRGCHRFSCDFSRECVHDRVSLGEKEAGALEEFIMGPTTWERSNLGTPAALGGRVLSWFRVDGTGCSELHPARHGARSGEGRADPDPGKDVGVGLVFPQKPQATRAAGSSGHRRRGSWEGGHWGRPFKEALAELVDGVQEQTTKRSHLC